MRVAENFDARPIKILATRRNTSGPRLRPASEHFRVLTHKASIKFLFRSAVAAAASSRIANGSVRVPPARAIQTDPGCAFLFINLHSNTLSSVGRVCSWILDVNG